MVIFLFSLVCCPFVGATTCTAMPEKVKEVCSFYNFTSSEAKDLHHIKEVNRNTVIFDFTPLFASHCSPLSKILFCAMLFPFCSPRHDFVLLPCRNVCLSVHAACHSLFKEHYQEWPNFINCSSLPAQPSLCLPPPSSSSFTLPPSSKSSLPPPLSSLPSNASLSTKLQSGRSSPTFIAAFSFVPFLVILVFGWFFVRYLFRFYHAPSHDPVNTITYTSQHISPVSSPDDTLPPPNVSPPPPPLPPKRKNVPIYQNTSTLYAVADLRFDHPV